MNIRSDTSDTPSDRPIILFFFLSFSALLSDGIFSGYHMNIARSERWRGLV